MIRPGGRSRSCQNGRALPAADIIQVVIAAAALGAMGYVALSIRPLLEEKARLEEEKASLESEVAASERQIKYLRAELKKVQQQLAETFNMSRYEHRLDPVDFKFISSYYPGPARAFQLMNALREQDVGWYLGGRTPEQGFDSPALAAYVLAQNGTLDFELEQGEDLVRVSQLLRERLPYIDKPGIGDLVFYPAGYVLFHYVDQDDEPFVIGMTPAGIAALKPDFAKPIGYRRSGLD